MNNWVICESPLQLKNSLHYLKQSKNEACLFVRLNGNPSNDDKLLDIARDEKKPIFSSLALPGSLFQLIKMIMKCALYTLAKGKVGILIVGDYNSKWMRSLIYVIRPSEVVVVDDGFATINIVRNRVVSKRHDRVKFYTSFDFSEDEVDYISQSVNRSKVINSNSVLIIGSPVIEKGITCLDDYIFYVDKVATHYSSLGYKVIYCPHRSENCYKKIDFPDFNIYDIFVPDIDIETSILKGDISCIKVVGLFSTALHNLSQLVENLDIISVRVPDGFFISRSEGINNVYEYLSKNNNIKVVDLDGFMVN